uniref:DDE Tnp4 domain-containing protein n=1 Tax=Photinus pyralis TaxID=7054 RepID=A0A1Y1N285_PHOPY
MRNCFLYVNVGVNGRISDGGVFRECKLSKAMMENKLNFPRPMPLPARELKVPFVVVADDAFPLLPNLLKPYSQRGLSHDCRIFNYRLSRARRVIENAFGILANRFRVLLNPINLSANKTETITLACVVLHNFLATRSVSYVEITPEELATNKLETLLPQRGNRPSNHALQVREEFKNFFCSVEGSVPWQENSIANYDM